MNRTVRNVVRGTRGQSLVEFALILPMMLVVMFMITEFGRALYQYNVINTATREACREAVVSSSANAVGVAKATANRILTAGNIKSAIVDAQILDNYQGSGIKVVKVTADKTFDWAFKGPLTMVGGGKVSATGFTLHGETYMHAEAF